MKNSTKLKINEIKDLVELCLSRCHFLWNTEFHESENSGPIGLSLMVTMAESYLQFLEGKAINEALHEQPVLDLKTHRRYVDDSHTRFETFSSSYRFKDILNKQDERVQYTMQVETEDKELEFMDIETKNNRQGSYDFKVFRKNAITNVQVKPTSSHDPKILNGIFKGFVHRAYKICSEQYLTSELEFLINVFVENGYDERTLRKLMRDVASKFQISNDTQSQQNDSEMALPTITLPWIPSVSPKLRKVFRKAGYKVQFKANPNLQTILSKKNKVKLPPNSHPGIYKIPCGCNEVPPYIGKTKIRISSRIDQHQKYVEKEEWERSGAAQHAQTCPVGPSFDEASTIRVVHRKFELAVGEALEIQRHRSSKRFGGMNLDDGQYLKTTFWVPLMDEISKQENDRTRRVNRHLASNLTSEDTE